MISLDDHPKYEIDKNPLSYHPLMSYWRISWVTGVQSELHGIPTGIRDLCSLGLSSGFWLDPPSRVPDSKKSLKLQWF